MKRNPATDEVLEASTGEAVEVFFGDTAEWRDDQDALAARGVPVPLEHGWPWLADVSDLDHWFLTVRAEDGSVSAAVPVERHAPRSLPGHYRLRITRFGSGLPLRSCEAILHTLRELVHGHAEILGVDLEVFAPDAERRNPLEQTIRSRGFRLSGGARRYWRTARVSLAAEEDELLASFSASCRRFIRDPEKKGFAVESIDDPRWAPRMEELWNETFARTSTPPPERDWARRIAFAHRHPDDFRIVGTFGPGSPATESLVAFSCAMNNGDHAVFSDGASTRHLDSTVALSYAPMWDLIRWARAQGCAWFDMGGISEGTYEDSDDPRGGISDFKRRFTRDVIEVGREWTYRSPSIRSWLAHTIQTSASAFRGLVRRLEPDGS